jgi:hypothetical protein
LVKIGGKYSEILHEELRTFYFPEDSWGSHWDKIPLSFIFGGFYENCLDNLSWVKIGGKHSEILHEELRTFYFPEDSWGPHWTKFRKVLYLGLL